jgi:hypothetical protein
MATIESLQRALKRVNIVPQLSITARVHHIIQPLVSIDDKHRGPDPTPVRYKVSVNTGHGVWFDTQPEVDAYLATIA